MCEKAMDTEASGERAGRGAWSCLSCGALFASSALQRAHYKEDWHRYNLKRRVAGLAAVPLAEYERRATATAAAAAAPVVVQRCDLCNKSFASVNALSSHLNSRRHRQQAAAAPSQPPAAPVVHAVPAVAAGRSGGPFAVVVARGEEADTDSATDVNTDSDTEELDSSEWEQWEEQPRSAVVAAARRCLFCPHAARSVPRCVLHMQTEHSFFIPDHEYCCDVPGLCAYLREKIEMGFMCVWCSERGRAFRSAEAAQAHMAAAGHCRPRLDSSSRAEYEPFYDYSASYPDATGDKDDEVVEVETGATLASDGWSLTLGAGRGTVGHRDLLRYYRQRVPTTRALVRSDARRRTLSHAPRPVMPVRLQRAQRRAAQHAQRATLRLALKANKFQPHYRPQVNF